MNIALIIAGGYPSTLSITIPTKQQNRFFTWNIPLKGVIFSDLFVPLPCH